MLVKVQKFSDFEVKKMLRNSLLVENKETGEKRFIHRRVFNQLMASPELPLFDVELQSSIYGTYKWLAAPMTR